MAEQAYFLTVDWCSKGNRGIFCSTGGQCFRKEGEPHTQDEMWEILDAFALVLAPMSELFTEDEVKEFSKFRPLAEYSSQYGVALKAGGE